MLPSVYTLQYTSLKKELSMKLSKQGDRAQERQELVLNKYGTMAVPIKNLYSFSEAEIIFKIIITTLCRKLEL